MMSKWFKKWSEKANISPEDLIDAINNIDKKNSLGAGLYKVRVARANEGKRSGFRTIIVYKKDKVAVFVTGFAKNEKDNLDKEELSYYKTLAKDLLSLTNKQLDILIKNEEYFKLEKKK